MRPKYSIAYKILACIMLLSFALSLPVYAKDTKNTIKVFLVDNEDQTHRYRTNVDVIIWQLASQDEESAKKEKESLDLLKVSQLKEQLGKPIYEGHTNEEGFVQLNDIDDLYYYYIRQSDESLEKVVVPTLIVGSHQEVYIKSTTPKPERGRRRFKKIDGKTSKALEGAKFKVTVLNEKKEHESVLRDNVQYSIVSDARGMMEVVELEYGQYFLWEVEAPKGYEKLTQPIPFEINEKSEYENIIGIKNMPHKPPKVTIPQTGDIILYVMCLGGLLLIGIGYKLIKE